MAIYLILMVCFSIFLIVQEKKVESFRLSSYASYENENIETVLENNTVIENTEKETKFTDLSKAKKQLVNKLGLTMYPEAEMALFTGDFNVIAHSNDYWICSYTEYREGNKNYSGYGYLNQNLWFSEKDIKELEEYLYAHPKAEKAGDLSGYSIDLESFWVDNEMVIPDKIIVTPMYADSFDENGLVNSGSGIRTREIVYTSKYKNNRELPHYEEGGIIPVNSYNRNIQGQSKLRELAMDKGKLKEAVEQGKIGVSYQRINLFEYTFYLVQPYKYTIKLDKDNQKYSEFWIVSAGKINFFDKCKNTLAFVWSSCFLTFIAAAFILSAQTYKTYKKREELDRQRNYTTNALAHDLKTPLSIISGYAQNLIENIHSEKREYYAANIQSNVSRMDGIIRKMLELSKIESELIQLKYEEVSLGRVSYELRECYMGVCNEKQITCLIEGDALINADKSLIERVLDNFFVNALDNTPVEGTIRIRISKNTFEFYNSGSQIPEDMLKEIWQPYKKADEARGNTKGTGLGLSIARTILELHNFSYGAKNNEDGVIFWFQFSAEQK
jgi:signal transduction histidine kinase